MIKDFNALKEKAIALKNNRLASTNHNGVGTYSVNIVNNKNGKRVSFTKALVAKLGLTDSVDIVVLEEDHTILIGRNLPFEEAKTTYKLSGDDKKLIYNSTLIQELTEIFSLDFGGKTSKSFTEITFNTDDSGVMAAVVLK